MSSAEVDFNVIGEQVMTELNRRLGSPELAQDLPGTLLMKVAMDYVKHLEAANAIERAKLEQVRIDPLEMIDQAGLTIDKRVAILAEYLEELESYWTSASGRMEELLREVTQDETEMVPDVQAVVSDE